jgi:hypothetical protein
MGRYPYRTKLTTYDLVKAGDGGCLGATPELFGAVLELDSRVEGRRAVPDVTQDEWPKSYSAFAAKETKMAYLGHACLARGNFNMHRPKRRKYAH